MDAKRIQVRGHKTRRALLQLLKTEGPLSSSKLADRLGVTAMAVRQHLYALQAEKFVNVEERPGPIGRPAKYWRLTPEADRFFPDAYAELSVSLIASVEDAFGPSGVQQLLKSRCSRQQAAYAARISPSAPLKKRLQQLARIRTEEGYMAEVRVGEDGTLLLLENHCPICAAATQCQGFCSAELDLFRNVLGPGVQIEREEHILSGARRCAYRVRNVSQRSPQLMPTPYS
ncbi:MAG TPA: metalloregulator ArsR/SmtB family transcription factor [Acidobacteriota bacterium]|nr:metalloregulator ArsR/SmtB family transcription factor [Acidobacteriota bacterium]